MISVRINSGEQTYLDEILDRVKTNPLFGVDLALYDEQKFHAKNIFNLLDLPVRKRSMHLNHYRYDGKMMVDGLEGDAHRAFLQDVSFAHKLNIRKAVLHWTVGCDQVPSVRQASSVLSLFEDKDILPHIENLMVDYAWNRSLIEVMIKSGRHFGVCFDIGHAKLWGGASFVTWLAWLKDLKKHDISLMFHLHGNYGKQDDHLPIWLDADCEYGGEFAPNGITSVVRRLMAEFPSAVFVLETKAEFAIKNLDWVDKGLINK